MVEDALPLVSRATVKSLNNSLDLLSHGGLAVVFQPASAESSPHPFSEPTSGLLFLRVATFPFESVLRSPVSTPSAIARH